MSGHPDPAAAKARSEGLSVTAASRRVGDQLGINTDTLTKHRRVQLHFTPTSCSWLNLVECFFSIITRQAIRRGAFSSVADLTTAIETYIDNWNQTAEPFTWTKPPANSSTRSTTQRLKQALSYSPLGQI